MSDYEYTDSSEDTLAIASTTSAVRLVAHMKDAAACIFIANSDAPTVAAELLKAAGHDGLADLIGWESAEKKLQERRESVLANLLPEAAKANNLPALAELSLLDDRAINYIIDLEDGK